MSPVKLLKFGRKKDSTMPVSDTPVTRLSKIFQQTSFGEPVGTNGEHHAKLKGISETIPADIDESANQEPPTKGYTTWLDSHEISSSAIPTGKCLLVRDYSSSYSSGYCSSSTTQSAPPTCHVERSIGSCPSTEQCSLTNYARQFFEPKDSTNSEENYHTIATLRRTQSCSTRGWLAKRHRKQAWPRISGITRFSTPGTMSPSQIMDTDSCPAAIQSEYQGSLTVQKHRRCSLPPLGEMCATANCSPTSATAVAFTKFSLSPINTSDEGTCEPDVHNLSSFHPLAKKQRLESPHSSSSIHTNAIISDELDSTVPLEEDSMNESEVVPPVSSCGRKEDNTGRRKTLFDMIRHQSTPMLPSRVAPVLFSVVPSPQPSRSTERQECRLSLSRRASVPTEKLSHKLTHCMMAFDNHSTRFEDRRARALPVVDRTASGLHCVSPDTVADLVSGVGVHRNVRHVIIDCRFPYEYEGGHIQSAINIFTHSELVQEIFNRVPAQRPPGASGPPRLLGEGLARRLALTLKEPLSAPCEPISDDESWLENDMLGMTSFGDASDSELVLEQSVHTSLADSSPSSRSEPDMNAVGQGSGSNFASSQEPPFVVIFHCEFSSQRAPDLATFLRSIDRVSNYHRYPFLYFPEIYVMKGGYSAFYRKHAALCCPQNYVKMFHRDYRTQLRLYKRLTKRVSSACLACIRPQQPFLNSSADSARAANTTFERVDAMNSFVQILAPDSRPIVVTTSSVGLVSQVLEPVKTSATTEARLAMIDSMMRHGTGYQCHTMGTCDVDKENEPPVADVQALCSSSSPASSTSSRSSCDLQSNDPVESPPTSRSSPESTKSHDRTSLSDSPLSLAEVVVRVGRQVIAATLSSADPSAAQLLHKFAQPTEVTERIPLKRRNTVSDINNATSRLVQPRVSKRGVPVLPNPFSLESDEPNTPAAAGLRRVQTLQFTPVDAHSSMKRSEWFHAATPVIGSAAVVSSTASSLSNSSPNYSHT
ncbi:M-phase inducer phosphatase [Fasciola hepatica]|uniref:protein-tyrosine-phosphatase n=1 Tax=Fasciola hepatica TaxID=6192 RepID=A0A4E0RNX3_FASHE|nr:M-phase inducer phosphatase [Fasciola hepatica]